MKYCYTRETLIPIAVEMTYQDLANVKRLAELYLSTEEKPKDFWESDIRRLRDEAVDAMSKASASTIFLRVDEEGV